MALGSGVTVGALVAALSLDKGQFEKDTASAKGTFGSLASTAKTALLGVGAALIGAGLAAFKMGADYQDALNILLVGSKQTTEEIEASFNRVAQRVPQDLKTVAETMDILGDRTDLTGQDLEDLAVSVLDFARVTRTDAKAAAEGLAKAYAQWGVATEDQIEVQNQLLRASEASGIGTDVLLDKITQFGPAFRDMGLGMDQSIALLASFEKGGVQTDKAIAGLQKAMVTFAKEGKTTEEGLAGVVSRIQELGPGADSTALAMETFGAKAGPQLRDAILSGSFSIDEMVAAVHDAGITVDSEGDRILTFGDRVSMGFNKLTTTVGSKMNDLMPMLGPLVDSAFSAIADVLSWFVENVMPPLIDGFKWFSETIIPAVSDALNGLIGIFTGAGESVGGVASGVGSLGEIVQGFVDGAWALLREGLSWFTDNLLPVFQSSLETAKANFDSLVEGIAGFVDGIMPGLNSAFDFFGTKVMPVVNDGLAFLGETIIPAIGAAFQWFAENVLPVVGQMLGDLLNNVIVPLASFIFDVLVNVVFPALAAAFDFITRDVLPPLIGLFNFLWHDVLEPLWNNVLQPVAKFLVDVFGAAFNFISKEVLPPVIGALTFLWRDVLEPLWNNVLKPVADFLVGVLKKAFDLLRPAIDFVSDAFDALADVVRWVWDHVLKPIADFIAGALTTTFQAWQRIIQVTADVFNGAMDAINDAITWVGDSIRKVIDGITGFFQQLIASAQDVARKVGEFLGSMFDPLLDGINHVINVAKDIWNGFVRFWNGFEIVIPAIAIGDFQITPKIVFGLPDLPLLAFGTKDFRGGLALVGERGPELAYLPAHTQVFPANETAAMMRGMGGNGSAVETMNVYGQTPDEVERQVERAYRRMALEWSVG